MNDPEISKWQNYVTGLDFKPLFVTVSGSHIYGLGLSCLPKPSTVIQSKTVSKSISLATKSASTFVC